MTIKLLIAIVGLFAAGVAGLRLAAPTLSPFAPVFLSLGGVLLAYLALKAGFYRTGSPWDESSTEPKPLRVGLVDYLKAMVSWLLAFQRTYAVEPGLYYTGDSYDPDAPLLVTSNYHLTVMLVVRHARAAGVRLLVVDTDGINVWCAAGKGAFSNAAIQKQLERYDRALLTDGKWIKVVLPKFGLAGVDIRALRKAKIHPVIGPLYAKDLPAYLANPPLKDRDDDRVHFGLQMRTFSWLPGFVQLVGYSILLLLLFAAAAVLTGSSMPWAILPIIALIATAYPLLFPWIPGKRFAVKGLWLATVISLALVALWASGGLLLGDLLATVLFSFAEAIFVGLAYTGNSAVSNYSKVRKETAQFFVPDLLLFLLSLTAFIITEVVG